MHPLLLLLIYSFDVTCNTLNCLKFYEKVQVGNDQEKSQSENDSHSKKIENSYKQIKSTNQVLGLTVSDECYI